MNNEFYIGWQSAAPKSFVQTVRKYLLLIFPLVLIAGILLAVSQKPFSKGTFEFGTVTEVKGIYYHHPVPCLKAINGKDIWGNYSYLTIPLVGFGKHGAEGIIKDIEQEKGVSLTGKEVTLKGTLLYNDGKTLMQVDANDHPLVAVSNKSIAAELQPVKKELGTQTFTGEIADPKCYFGVMKPGQGKPHRDCAVRCILGGIPPVFVVTNDKGENNYYLLVGPHGEKLNETVQDVVAEPVQVEARAVQYDDWIVLYITGEEKIQRYSYIHSRFGKQVQYCAANCLK